MTRVYKTSEATRLRAKEYGDLHREARREYHKRWRTENKEKFSALMMARRARKKGATGRYTAEQWTALNDAFGWRCLRCGAEHSQSPLTKDHIVPLAAGGANDIDNIQPLCLPCNLWKNARTIDYRRMHPEEREAAESALAPLRGRKKSTQTPEVRARIAEALTGFKHGAEARANMARGVKDSWVRRGPRSDSTSGVRGVTWDSESGKWCASVSVGGKKKRLGRFMTVELAAAAISAYRRAAPCESI